MAPVVARRRGAEAAVQIRDDAGGDERQSDDSRDEVPTHMGILAVPGGRPRSFRQLRCTSTVLDAMFVHELLVWWMRTAWGAGRPAVGPRARASWRSTMCLFAIWDRLASGSRGDHLMSGTPEPAGVGAWRFGGAVLEVAVASTVVAEGHREPGGMPVGQTLDRFRPGGVRGKPACRWIVREVSGWWRYAQTRAPRADHGGRGPG